MSTRARDPEATPAEARPPSKDDPTAVPVSPEASRTEQNKKHVFGLQQDAPPRHEPIFPDDYEKRFPKDSAGEETKPNARVYRVYVEEAAAYDATMVGQYRDGLDVMLVFAGLFSAVVTSFLVQVSQSLQADYAQMSALLLHDLVSIQLSDGASAVNITAPSVNPTQEFVPDVLNVCINGLWVVSLVTALVVALATVLVKQWLHRYVSLPSGTPMDRSHVRQFRFMGLERWRVHVIIGMLPLTMHLSLMLFLAGLALFFLPLHASLAWTIGIITTVVCVAYLLSNALPILFPQCPYQTPLTDFFHYAHQITASALSKLWKQIFRWLCVCCPLQSRPHDTGNRLAAGLRSFRALETEVVRKAHPILSKDSLLWLFDMSSNPSVQIIVVQAICGLFNEEREPNSDDLLKHLPVLPPSDNKGLDDSPVSLKVIVTYPRAIIREFLNILAKSAPIFLSAEETTLLVLGHFALHNLDRDDLYHSESCIESVEDHELPYLDILHQVCEHLVERVAIAQSTPIFRVQSLDDARLHVHVPSVLGKHHVVQDFLQTALNRITLYEARTQCEQPSKLISQCFNPLFIMCNTIKTTNTTYQPLSYEAFYEYLNHYVVASLLDLHRPDVVYMHSPAEVNFTLQALDESTMLTALSRGSSSALRIFGDMQWIRFLGMGWVVANIPFPKSIYRPISCYLTGLCKVNDPERQYQSYLCENPNLVIAFLCLSEDATEVNRLFEVCTRHSDWQQCRDTLKALLKWMQLDRSERRLVVCPIIVPRSLGCTHRFPPNMGPHLSKALDEEWADVWLHMKLAVLYTAMPWLIEEEDRAPPRWKSLVEETEPTFQESS